MPATRRERAPLPTSKRQWEILGRLADAFEAGDIDGVVELLTDDAWLTMPPEPYEYQGASAIGAFLNNRGVRRGTPLRLVPTRANGIPPSAVTSCSRRPRSHGRMDCSSSRSMATGSQL